MLPFVLAPLALAEPLVDAIDVTVADHSVALPFGNLWPRDAWRPSLSVGAEHTWAEGAVGSFVQTARVGARVHPLAGGGPYVATEALGRLAHVGYVEAGLGVGAQHTLHGRVLVWDQDRYVERTDAGRLGLTAGFVLGAGAGVGDDVQVGLSYRWFVHAPWIPAVPVGPKADFGLTARWSL